ncbi:MAG: hypothetical protein KA603_11375 [Azonexus sp.]|jgi:hypothetical protein|nr:hypothetical protein [Azonexus sp.]MBP6905509.1 hypothetical protein [Azonexus sp.]
MTSSAKPSSDQASASTVAAAAPVSAPPAVAAAAATIRKPVVAAKPAAEKSTRSAKSAAAKPAKIVAPAGKVTRKEAVRSAPGEGAPKADKEAKARKAEKTGKAAKAEPPRQARAEKPRKAKMVRDSFTMPEGEYVRIAGLKKRLLGLKIAAKKSELLRAGIALLDGLKDAELLAAVARVEKVKTGRPAKSGK